MATKASKEVLYESIHQADLEYKRAADRGFEQHASQVKTDEGNEKAVPSWRKEQIELRKEEENEDLAELAVVAPKQYKRKMARSKQQLQKKEDIYAIIKMAEQGEDVLDDLLVAGKFGGVGGDRSDTDDDDAEEEGGGEAMEGFGGDAAAQLTRQQKMKSGINRNRRATERFNSDGGDDLADELASASIVESGAPARELTSTSLRAGSTAFVESTVRVGRSDSVSQDLKPVSPAKRPSSDVSALNESPVRGMNLPGTQVARRWYVGKLERGVCETAVRACMQGDYLVRKSASSTGFVLCINDSGQAINYTISVPKSSPNKLSFTSRIFNDLDQVIQYTGTTPLKSIAKPGSRLVINKPAIVQAWFSMGMSRQECEDMVKNAKHGDFMVRLSSSGEKYVLVVNDKRHACSYSITMNADKNFVFGGTVHECVENVVKMMKGKAFKSQFTEEMTLNNPASASLAT